MLYFDSTFKSYSKPFFQLFIIYKVKNVNSIPFFLFTKTIKNYKNAFFDLLVKMDNWIWRLYYI